MIFPLVFPAILVRTGWGSDAPACHYKKRFNIFCK
jgi:hypothetical protein